MKDWASTISWRKFLSPPAVHRKAHMSFWVLMALIFGADFAFTRGIPAEQAVLVVPLILAFNFLPALGLRTLFHWLFGNPENIGGRWIIFLLAWLVLGGLTALVLPPVWSGVGCQIQPVFPKDEIRFAPLAWPFFLIVSLLVQLLFVTTIDTFEYYRKLLWEDRLTKRWLSIQIAEHFMRNSFNRLNSFIVLEKNEKASEMAVALGHLIGHVYGKFRVSFAGEGAENDWNDLAQEIELLQMFVRLRFDEVEKKTARVSVVFRHNGEPFFEIGDEKPLRKASAPDLEEMFGEQKIVRLLLMDFVENAFKFGFFEDEQSDFYREKNMKNKFPDGPPFVNIELDIDGDKLRLQTQNSRSLAARTGSQTGLRTIRQVLWHFYRNRDFEINDTTQQPDFEYFMKLKLPLYGKDSLPHR